MPRIDRMINNIKKFGVFTPNKYLIEFSGFLGISDFAQGNRMSLMCNSVSAPGRSIATAPDKNYAGPSREIPYDSLYGSEITLNLFLGKDMWERRVFETWMDGIVDPRSGRLAYYDDYKCDMYIYVLNEFDMPIYRIRVEEVFPKAIGELTLSNEGGGAIAQQSVTLAFRRYVPTIISFGGAVAAEFLYDVPAVRNFDEGLGGTLQELGILGGEYGNPFNFSQLFEVWADGGAATLQEITGFNIGGMGNWL